MAFNRRAFLTFLAGGVVGTGLTPIPYTLIDDISIWTQNWPWIPRVPDGALSSKPSLVKLGAAEYGIRVNTVDGQPVTASGSPEHPLSLGGIDPLAAASVQLMYSPARVGQPLLREAGGGFRPLSWGKAEDILVDKLGPLVGREGSVACINGDETSSAGEVFSALLGALHSESGHYSMPSEAGTYRAVWQGLMNGQGSIGFDLENADTVLCLDADLLESWGTAVRNQKVLGQRTAELLYAGPVLNGTAALADKWIPVRPGRGSHLALALASILMREGAAASLQAQGLDGLQAYLRREYPEAAIQDRTGIPASRVKRLARRLAAARRPLVVAGSLAGDGGDPALVCAGLILNGLLGRINARGGIRCIPSPPTVSSKAGQARQGAGRDLSAFVSGLAQGRGRTPDLLLVYEANPVYGLPDSTTAESALSSIPFKVSFSQFMDETAAACDLILPAPYFMERLDDAFTPFGSRSANYSVAEPVAPPQADCRPIPDFLLRIMQRLEIDMDVGSYRELLQTKAHLLGARWKSLRQGTAWEDETVSEQRGLTFWNGPLEACLRQAAARSGANGELSLALQTDLKSGTSRTAIPPFGLSALSEDELDESGLFVRLNPRTASELNLEDGHAVTLSSQSGQCRAKVRLDEGLIPGAVAVPTGFGHSHWDEFSRGKGGSAYTLLVPSYDADCGRSTWSDTSLTIAKI